MKDSVKVIIDLLRDLYPSGEFKAFYDGDPDVIPVVNLPAIAVTKLDDDTRLGATGMDRIEERLIIKVIMDKKADWGARTDNVRLTERRIRDLVEERDETGDYAVGTIKGKLRRNLQLEGRRISGDMRFELGSLPRSRDLVTSEGHLYLTVITNLMVNNRG